ncbi:MAG: GrpB family protein [Proteobacteria bacterium]|nr:GrpB family protein [Pseudomonadota bacterium]
MAARVVSVVPFDPSWAGHFEAERLALAARLGAQAQIHHIGSTAVPGLCAKPIIDIVVEVPDVAQLDALQDALRALGYQARGENGIESRRYFVKGVPQRTHHLHAFTAGSPHVVCHLALRDWLRRDPEARATYAATKQRVAAACGGDPHRYVALKDDAVKVLVASALAASATGWHGG